MFDFKQATVFSLGYRLSKHKMTRYAKNWVAWLPGPPGAVYDSVSQNNSNLLFKFAIRQNKCNHLLLYLIRIIKFCARKLLLSLVVSKLIFNYEVFSTKLYVQEIFASQKN